MLMNRKLVVGDAERALIYRNRRIERVLGPGVHRVRALFDEVDIALHNIAVCDYTGKDVDVLVDRLGDRLSEHFVLADLGAQEVGLVLKNGRVEDVLAPGTRRLYWKGLVAVEVRSISLGAGLELDEAIAKRLRQLGLLDKFAATVAVPEEHLGLLFVDGKLSRALSAGTYAFWNVFRNVVSEVVDLRVQSVEVSGQELLTRDKVSLRVNLAASYRVDDPVIARTKVSKVADVLYRELQFGLRKAVSARTLDELLGDKAALDAEIFGHAHGQVRALGIEVLGVGVKDLILPGEMKEILNSVVQAEKSAQANVIRRREEANATRSLLNTAKLIEESPVLMRLKELEALEKVTEKIDKLTVFGGLDGVLKQLVTLKS
ncbi:slipin family protein [Arenimonas sp.]|uniref:slipin family protein n=1 Tax=Arenimonas sp. TaxID=1872635 RepID=UPI0039E48DA7